MILFRCVSGLKGKINKISTILESDSIGMKKIILFLLLIAGTGTLFSQNLTIPVDGSYGADYIIVNYPDWHTINGTVLVQDGVLNDHHCGTKTYDGHQGTDFVIRGFTQMDTGVAVLACADGEIITVIDSLFDRETGGIIALGLGNYVGIYHSTTDTYSYYAHLKKNSVPVQVGDLVTAGQIIGEIGSSGNSTDPHLHYELWNPGVITDPTIDPWGIPCDSGTNLWLNPPVYDTSYNVWECGLVNYDSVENFVPQTWDPLRKRLGQKDNFTVNDPFFTFWALQYGLKIGDQTVIEWYEPNGNLYSIDTTWYTTQDWWYHYYNHSITNPPANKQGEWTIRYYYNGTLQVTKPFIYGTLDITEQRSENVPYYFKQANGIEIVLPNKTSYSDLTLVGIKGDIILRKSLNDEQIIHLSLPQGNANGYYVVVLKGTDAFYNLKVVFD